MSLTKNKCCGYIVNEEPFYMFMTAFSISCLRKFNKEVPISVVYVKDEKQASKRNASCYFEQIKNPIVKDEETFLSFLKKNNVGLLKKPLPDLNGEEKYWAAHRFYFNEIECDSFLLIDADTFFYDDVNIIFEHYNNVDFAADRNIFDCNIMGMRPFNSGVMLFNKGLHKTWAKSVPDYCYKLYHREHPYSEWLWNNSTKDCSGREELAATLFVKDNNLNWCYFDKMHCQTEIKSGKCIIFHSLSKNWLRCFQ